MFFIRRALQLLLSSSLTNEIQNSLRAISPLKKQIKLRRLLDTWDYHCKTICKWLDMVRERERGKYFKSFISLYVLSLFIAAEIWSKWKFWYKIQLFEILQPKYLFTSIINSMKTNQPYEIPSIYMKCTNLKEGSDLHVEHWLRNDQILFKIIFWFFLHQVLWVK